MRSSTPVATAPAHAAAPARSASAMALAAASGATFLAYLDVTVVNVAFVGTEAGDAAFDRVWLLCSGTGALSAAAGLALTARGGRA